MQGNNSKSAWYFDGANTIQLNKPQSLSQGQGASSSASKINNQGLIGGSTTIFDIATGQPSQNNAWLYNLSTNQFFDLILSTSSDGQSNSSIYYLGDDGLVLGTYSLFNGYNNLGVRAFAFNISSGLTDLGLLVDGDLGIEGWTAIASAWRSNTNRQIVGNGKLINGSDSAFLMTAISGSISSESGFLPGAFSTGSPPPQPVSVPAAAWLMGSGLIGLVGLSRRKK